MRWPEPACGIEEIFKIGYGFIAGIAVKVIREKSRRSNEYRYGTLEARWSRQRSQES